MTRDEEAREIADKLIAKLSEIREEQSFSYDNLAMLTDTTKATIHAIEAGKSLPNLMTLIKLCLALDIKLSDLAKDGEF